jgi:hypothetical protein
MQAGRIVRFLTWSGLGGAVVAAALGGAEPTAGNDPLPIFDAHIHYSQPAWSVFDTGRVIAKFDAAGVPRVLVSSSPDDGTVMLYEAAPDRVVPELRPYRGQIGPSSWHSDKGTPAYIAERLTRGIYKGIGEVHMYDDAAARAPVAAAVVRMAVERGLLLHIHSGAGPIEIVFDQQPEARVLWAHAGMVEPPAVIDALLGRHENLWAELSFRADEINTPDGIDPEWRALFLKYPDRFVIGSDTWVNGQWSAYEALIAAQRRWLTYLPQPVATAIAHGNADRLFPPVD